MAKIQAKFDTYAVNSTLDPSGGYTLRLKERPIYDESQVFEEVVKEKTLPFDPALLEFAFLSVLKTMALKVSRDCNPRKVGNYLRFMPTLRGKVKGPYSPFDPATCSSAIVITSLSGLEKEVDRNYVTFVNANAGVRVIVNRVSWIGSDEPNVVKKGEAFGAYGTNLMFDSSLGDTVTVTWKDASDTEHTATLTPSESDYDHMKFSWPGALDEIAEGTELTFTFRTRGGIEDADEQVNVKKVVVTA